MYGSDLFLAFGVRTIWFPLDPVFKVVEVLYDVDDENDDKDEEGGERTPRGSGRTDHLLRRNGADPYRKRRENKQQLSKLSDLAWHFMVAA